MKTTESLPKLSLTIGGYKIGAVPTGIFALDGGAMFGTVPKVLWQKTNPADSENRIPMEARALLLQSEGRNILIDTGNGSDFVAKYGDKMGMKFGEMYSVQEGGVSLNTSLQGLDISVNDITDVILTHLHFDHAGGATCAKDGKIVPTFPNATYHVQRSNYENAMNPNVREKASYLKPNFVPLMEAGVLKLVDGPQQNYLPNISLIVSDGHTVGQQLVAVEDDNTQVIYCGDLIPTSTHIRSAWVMGYDINPLVVIEEKSRLLKRTDNKTSYLYFEHDPYCDLASVEKKSDTEYQVKERFVL